MHRPAHCVTGFNVIPDGPGSVGGVHRNSA
jgi:hypothetical protein